jgi:hypothetical protein
MLYLVLAGLMARVLLPHDLRQQQAGESQARVG